jgi:hypothetical protein
MAEVTQAEALAVFEACELRLDEMIYRLQAQHVGPLATSLLPLPDVSVWRAQADNIQNELFRAQVTRGTGSYVRTPLYRLRGGRRLLRADGLLPNADLSTFRWCFWGARRPPTRRPTAA